VTISRACNPGKRGPRRQWTVIVFSLVTISITACTAPALPTRAPLPTFSGGVDVATSTPITEQPGLTPAADTAGDPSSGPLPEADPLLLEQPLGADRLTLALYADSAGLRCVRYTIDARRDFQPVSACATSARATLVAVRGIETDSLGASYSIVAGRVLDARITAVSIEFSDGSNTPAEVQAAGDDLGFAVILPGRYTAIRAIPIDQYGNLVGDKFTFR
jgi:hypothetical protein